jgi:hypothetical protein
MDDPSDPPTVENHVYGRDLAGIERCRFNAATGRMRLFITGKYANEWLLGCSQGALAGRIAVVGAITRGSSGSWLTFELESMSGCRGGRRGQIQ